MMERGWFISAAARAWLKVGIIVTCAGMLIAWAICHVRFCLDVLTFAKPSEGHFSWLIGLNLAVLVYALVGLGYDHHERHRGVLGGFILGITPLGLTGLAFVTASPLLPQFLSGETVELVLPPVGGSLAEGEGLRTRDDRILLFGVDVSKSVVSPKQPFADQICQAMRFVLLRSPEPPNAVPDEPGVWVRAFAEDHRLIVSQGDGLGELSRNDVVKSACEELERVSENPFAGGDQTDIVTFLHDMLGPVRGHLREGAHVVLVIFSDFFQDTPDVASGAFSRRLQSLTASFRELEEAASREEVDPVLTVVGIKVGRGDTSGIKKQGRDVLRDLRDGLGPIWREVHLDDLVGEQGEVERTLMISSLLAPEVSLPPTEILSIRYSQGLGLPDVAALRLPPADSDFSIVGLRLSGRAEREGVSEFALEVSSGDDRGAGRTVLRTTDSPSTWRVHRFEGRSSGLLLLRLSGKMEGAESAQAGLVLSVPNKPVNYLVPVVITPVAGRFAQKAFALLVLFFAASVIILAAIEVLRLIVVAWRSRPQRSAE